MFLRESKTFKNNKLHFKISNKSKSSEKDEEVGTLL